MSARVGTCTYCKRRMRIHARTWCRSCYGRWDRAGRPSSGPPPRPERPQRTPWIPTGRIGLAQLARYGQLVAEGATRERIAWEMSIGDRQIQRYALAWRAQQQEQEKAA